MKTFTSDNPKHLGYTFSDAGIVWNDWGKRMTVHHSEKGPYVIIKSQRVYPAQVLKEMEDAGYV